MKRVALFLSCDSFEAFFGGTFGIDRDAYVTTYRNDFAWEYAEGLARLGHEAVIYVLSYGPAERRQAALRIGVRFVPMPVWLRPIDAVLYRLRGAPRAQALRAAIGYAAYRRAVRAALREDGIDVVYHQEVWSPRFDHAVADLPVPVIGADQGAVYADWMAPAKRASFPKAAWVLCQSMTGLQRAQEFGARATLAYNGVDTDFFVPSAGTDRADQKTILSVGRFSDPQKRFTDLLNALVLLPECTLVLVGSGPDEAMLKSLAASLGVADRVRWPGFMRDREELRRLYQTCSVFVSTSAWEAMALVLLEAMSCAAPVVVTRIPSFEDLLTDGVDGLLVPVGAPEAVARAIREAIGRGAALGARARETVVRRHSGASVYGRLSELIETAAASPAPLPAQRAAPAASTA